MESTIFYCFLFLHLSSLILAFGSVMVIDVFGLMWLFKKQTLAQVTKVAETTQKLIWIGWVGMVISGVPLITLKGYIDNLTKIKIFFVILVGLNGLYLHFVKKSLEKVKDKQKIPALVMFRMFLATSISQMGWWGALVIGFVHRHVEHTIPWPANPYAYMFYIAGFFLVVMLLGENLLKKK